MIRQTFSVICEALRGETVVVSLVGEVCQLGVHANQQEVCVRFGVTDTS